MRGPEPHIVALNIGANHDPFVLEPPKDTKTVFSQKMDTFDMVCIGELGLKNGKCRQYARLYPYVMLKTSPDSNSGPTQKYVLMKKIVHNGDWKRRNRYLTEVYIHNHVDKISPSPFVSRFYGVRDGRTSLDYVIDMGDTDMLQWVVGQFSKYRSFKKYGVGEERKMQEVFIEEHQLKVRQLVAQVADGMNSMFKSRVVHFDMKLENIVLVNKKNVETFEASRDNSSNKILQDFQFIPQIIDFGLAKHFNKDQPWAYDLTRKGTPRYMSPEIACQTFGDSRKTDLWSLGICIWEALTGFPLWLIADPSKSDPYRLMVEAGGFGPYFKELKETAHHLTKFVPPLAVDLLHNLLHPDHTKRYSIEQVLEHGYVKRFAPKLVQEPRKVKKRVIKNGVEVTPNSSADSPQAMSEDMASPMTPHPMDKKKSLGFMPIAQPVRVIKRTSVRIVGKKKLLTAAQIEEAKRDQEKDHGLGDVKETEDGEDQDDAKETYEANNMMTSNMMTSNPLPGGGQPEETGLDTEMDGGEVKCGSRCYQFAGKVLPYSFCIMAYWTLAVYIVIFELDVFGYDGWLGVVSMVLPLMIILFMWHGWKGYKIHQKFRDEIRDSLSYQPPSVAQMNERHQMFANRLRQWVIIYTNPIATSLDFLLGVAVCVYWYMEEDLNIKEFETGSRAAQHNDPKNIAMFGFLIAVLYRVTSAVYVHMRYSDEQAWAGFLQLIDMQIYHVLQQGVASFRQTFAIQDQKIIQGTTFSFYMAVLELYFLFNYSNDWTTEWQVLTSLVVSLLSLARVYNLTDSFGIIPNSDNELQFIFKSLVIMIFRLSEIVLRASAFAILAAAWNPQWALGIFFIQIAVMFFIYKGLKVDIGIGRFSTVSDSTGCLQYFWRGLGVIFDTFFATIACPSIIHAKWYYPIVVISNGSMMFVSRRLDNPNFEFDDFMMPIITAWAVFFLFGVLNYCTLDLEQFEELFNLLRTKDVKKVLAKKNEFVLGYLLASGNITFEDVQNQVNGDDWDVFREYNHWLELKGFFKLPNKQTIRSVKAVTERQHTRNSFANAAVTNFLHDEEIKMTISLKAWKTADVDDMLNVITPTRNMIERRMRSKCRKFAVHPEGRFMAIAFDEAPYLELVMLPGLRSIWDLQHSEHLGAVVGVAFIDIKSQWRVVIASEDGYIRFFSLMRGELESAPVSIEGGLKGLFPERDPDKGKVKTKARATSRGIFSFAVTPNSSYIAVGMSTEGILEGPVEHGVWLYHWLTGNTIFLTDHTGPVWALAFSPDSSFLVTGSQDCTVKMYTTREVDHIWAENDRGKRKSSMSADYLFVDTDGHPDDSWQSVTDMNSPGIRFPVRCVAVSSDGKAVVAGHTNGKALVWKKKERSERSNEWQCHVRLKHKHWVDDVAFMEGADNILVAGCRSGEVVIWDWANIRWTDERPLVKMDHVTYGAVSCLALSRDKPMRPEIITGCWTEHDDFTIMVWVINEELDKAIEKAVHERGLTASERKELFKTNRPKLGRDVSLLQYPWTEEHDGKYEPEEKHSEVPERFTVDRRSPAAPIAGSPDPFFSQDSTMVIVGGGTTEMTTLNSSSNTFGSLPGLPGGQVSRSNDPPRRSLRSPPRDDHEESDREESSDSVEDEKRNGSNGDEVDYKD